MQSAEEAKKKTDALASLQIAAEAEIEAMNSVIDSEPTALKLWKRCEPCGS